MPWGNEEKERLVDLVNLKKYTFSEITHILNREFKNDRSRNSIIGMYHRSLDKCVTGKAVTDTLVKKQDFKECRYIKEDYTVCGGEIYKRCYCEEHYKICYITD